MKDKNITNTMYGQWEFNKEVSECFDEMLNRSIPDFKNLVELITGICTTNKNSPRILDIGCGTGTSIKPVIDRIPSAEYYGLDNSAPMINEANKKFFYHENTNFIIQDITKKEIDYKNMDICLSVLTLQFIPINYRSKILKDIYKSLNKNGIFIFVEKVWSQTLEIENILSKLYYNHKQQEYYTEEEIEHKKQKLVNTLIPLTTQMNQELLENAGFKKIDIFWKNLNFVGFIAIK